MQRQIPVNTDYYQPTQMQNAIPLPYYLQQHEITKSQLTKFSQMPNAVESLQMAMNPYLMDGSSIQSNKPFLTLKLVLTVTKILHKQNCSCCINMLLNKNLSLVFLSRLQIDKIVQVLYLLFFNNINKDSSFIAPTLKKTSFAHLKSSERKFETVLKHRRTCSNSVYGESKELDLK